MIFPIWLMTGCFWRPRKSCPSYAQKVHRADSSMQRPAIGRDGRCRVSKRHAQREQHGRLSYDPQAPFYGWAVEDRESPRSAAHDAQARTRESALRQP